MSISKEAENFKKFGQALANAAKSGDMEAMTKGLDIAAAFFAGIANAVREPFQLFIDLLPDGDIDKLEPVEALADAFTARWGGE